ncbi:DUF1284 domain-containing protein [Paenibacillus cremeus]|uniref:DUF1284 domain-containing protein n=1 Tax=Paenibacillus cremeus TaxID=2163881 RepID=A0A559KFI1_9BACL|nr:DUF1284 domain-containing protein [Paenibacillus cremeus]TVY10877.1 DUF1284 domain-containing protein [Paenibacillus cremeus]
MEIRLRGHHLLCLLGFRGMGYSAAFSANMTRVYNELRESPETTIALVQGPDDLCTCFPADGQYHCENRSVAKHDEEVIRRLGLETGTRVPWSTVLERVRAAIAPEDINVLCVTCQWRSYGVCEAGVRTIRQGEGLPPLP